MPPKPPYKRRRAPSDVDYDFFPRYASRRHRRHTGYPHDSPPVHPRAKLPAGGEEPRQPQEFAHFSRAPRRFEAIPGSPRSEDEGQVGGKGKGRAARYFLFVFFVLVRSTCTFTQVPDAYGAPEGRNPHGSRPIHGGGVCPALPFAHPQDVPTLPFHGHASRQAHGTPLPQHHLEGGLHVLVGERRAAAAKLRPGQADRTSQDGQGSPASADQQTRRVPGKARRRLRRNFRAASSKKASSSPSTFVRRTTWRAADGASSSTRGRRRWRRRFRTYARDRFEASSRQGTPWRSA